MQKTRSHAWQRPLTDQCCHISQLYFLLIDHHISLLSMSNTDFCLTSSPVPHLRAASKWSRSAPSQTPPEGSTSLQAPSAGTGWSPAPDPVWKDKMVTKALRAQVPSTSAIPQHKRIVFLLCIISSIHSVIPLLIKLHFLDFSVQWSNLETQDTELYYKNSKVNS